MPINAITTARCDLCDASAAIRNCINQSEAISYLKSCYWVCHKDYTFCRDCVKKVKEDRKKMDALWWAIEHG